MAKETFGWDDVNIQMLYFMNACLVNWDAFKCELLFIGLFLPCHQTLMEGKVQASVQRGHQLHHHIQPRLHGGDQPVELPGLHQVLTNHKTVLTNPKSVLTNHNHQYPTGRPGPSLATQQ